MANAYPGRKSGTGVAQVDSSSDGNAGVVSPRQPPLISSPLPQPPTPLAGQGRLLEEKNDRISKEKQKFFRLSAFNAEHSKLKRVGGGDKSRSSRNVSARSTRGTANPKGETSRVSSSSSGDGSSTSEAGNSSESSDGSDSSEDDDEDDDDEDDEEGHSSSESSDSSSSDEVQHTRIESPKMKAPFACDLSEDKPWGFAAAAAKLNVESPFFSNITNTFGAPLPKLDVSDTPTFGLHIQPAAVNTTDSKKKHKSERNVTQVASGFANTDNKVKPGSGQLRGLFDGLSHFFSAPADSRARSAGVPAPNYAPNRRKRSNTADATKTNKVPRGNQRNKPADDSSDASKLKERKKIEVTEISRVPKPGIFVPSDENLFSSLNEKLPRMTPSNLVKTAVNSKRHEHERRKLMKDDASSLVKCASTDPSSPTSSSRHDQQQQQSRKKHTAADANQIRHPVPAPVAKSGLSSDSVKSNPNPKSNPRACTSATTTNTTTTPRATPCSTRKGKSLPHPFTSPNLDDAPKVAKKTSF